MGRRGRLKTRLPLAAAVLVALASLSVAAPPGGDAGFTPDEVRRLERHSPVLHLIQQIRDETHRFAVTFHRLRRGKRQTATALREIPGVGPKTAQKLLRHFGSVANIRRAGVDELSKVISQKGAEKVLESLQTKEQST